MIPRRTVNFSRLMRAMLAAAAAFTAQHQAGGQSIAVDPDVSAFSRVAASARDAFSADAGRLWGARLDTIPWMAVAGKAIYLTADPHQGGYTLLADSLWTGPIPVGITPANTSVTWAGKRWAMVVLPLPDDSIAAVRLLIHEAAHVAQPSVLPRPAYGETGAGSALLDEPAGRTWLLLEWRALASALRSSGAARRIRDALTFRAERYAVASEDERNRERVLDVTEGIPEYTAWKLTHSSDSAFAERIDSAPLLLSSFVRGFPYYTGPAYAMLLDDYTGGEWRREFSSTPDLQQLITDAMDSQPTNGTIPLAVLRALRGSAELTAPERAGLARLAERDGTRYGITTIQAAESARWKIRQHEIAEYRRRFVEQPTIRIRPGALSFSFDPRRQVSLGADGTIMANAVWKSKDGAMLTAPAGALVTPTWSELRIPLGKVHFTPGLLRAPVEAKGDGWTLTIPAGWSVAAEGTSVVILPPAARDKG